MDCSKLARLGPQGDNMAKIGWFLNKLRDPAFVDRPSEDNPQYQEELDSVVPPTPAAPQNPAERPLNQNAVKQMAGQLWGEGFGGDTLENPDAMNNPLSQERFPRAKKFQYNVKMRGEQQAPERGLKPLPSLVGGDNGY